MNINDRPPRRIIRTHNYHYDADFDQVWYRIGGVAKAPLSSLERTIEDTKPGSPLTIELLKIRDLITAEVEQP